MGKTVYEVEEFLKKPLELEKKVRDLEDHIASLKFIVEDTTTHLSPTAGRNPSKTSDSFEKVMLEAPAGKIEKGEEPFDCVSREITEETGFVADKIECVGSIVATPGYCSEIITLYIGTGLKYEGGNPDENEYIATVKMPLKEAVKMADEGAITDAKTQVLLYKAARRLGI